MGSPVRKGDQSRYRENALYYRAESEAVLDVQIFLLENGSEKSRFHADSSISTSKLAYANFRRLRAVFPMQNIANC